MRQTDTMSAEVKKKPQSKLGRRGDPRMHRAVAARLANPNLSLIEALEMGGFEFDSNGVEDANVKDKDGVTMGQRKNQLSRRLRLAKQNSNEVPQEGGVSSTRSSRRQSSISVEAQEQLQKIMQHSSQAIVGTGGGALTTRNSLKRSLEEQQEEPEDANRMAKFHPNYHPILVPQPNAATALANTTTSASAAVLETWTGTTLATQPPPLQKQKSSSSSTTNLNLLSHSVPPTVVNNTNAQPSGVAVASLRHTASTVGMTLEQLAMTLHATPNLSAILQNQNKGNEPAKQEVALNLYRSEIAALYKRCMHLAGFSTEQTQDDHAAYTEFTQKAWQTEGRRLEQVGLAAQQQNAGTTTAVLKNGSKCSNGRHVHRLEGKCGHKAIIHQPDDGPAHVDFLVNGKVECYMGIKPAGSSYWRSSFRCEHDDCDESDITVNKELNKVDPKLFDLNDIDLDGKEWSSSLSDTTSQGQIDETLLGLIKLGDNQSAEDTD